MTRISRWPSLLALAFLAASAGVFTETSPPGALAQESDAACSSFSELQSDRGQGRVYTIPIAYGDFADLEIAPLAESTTRLDIEVYEQSALRDRRITVVVPHRVELLTEILNVENLFDLGRPLFVRIEADPPVKVMLVRQD